MDIKIPVDNRMKIKWSEKFSKYLDHTGERKKLWKMKLPKITIVFDVSGTLPKDLKTIFEKSASKWKIEATQITAILR